MKFIRRVTRLSLRALILISIALPAAACAPGTVYVGVAAPGPWVGYPPGAYGGYPGYYGRPWYSPDEDQDPREAKPAREDGGPEGAAVDPGGARSGS